MDHHIDTSWCPVCDRQILPKRFLVPVIPSNPTPAPPPSSPTVDSPTKVTSHDAPTVRRTKSGAVRARPGGLVHGTGRVKPNGTLKRADSLTKPHVPVPVPAAPVKLRSVIDQGPIPLYCSDECQMADIAHNHLGFPHDFDPNRSSPPLPPAPHNSLDEPASVSVCGSDSDSSGSSVDSAYGSPSIDLLARIYNFPPMVVPPPVFDDNTLSSESEILNNYQSGIMMASKRIKEALSPERPKRSIYATNNYPPEPKKPIPGWTDGSNAWRSALYSFSAPTDFGKMDPLQMEKSTAAYRSFTASPHRSQGVYSTLSDTSRTTATFQPGGTLGGATSRSRETEELYQKYSQSLSRRSESRVSLFQSASPTSPHSPTLPHRRERSLLKPGAEGKLLVPNVKMKVHSGSSSSLSSAWCGSSYPGSRRGSSTKGSDSGEDVRSGSPLCTSLPGSKRPTVETRSWSYDNIKTYPVMPPVPKKEKRIEKKVIDGQIVDVEVEVEIVQPLKRLFLFADKKTVERR